MKNDNRTSSSKVPINLKPKFGTKVISGDSPGRHANRGPQGSTPLSMQPRVASKLKSASGAGSGLSGEPKLRTKNPISKSRKWPGDENEDAGNLKGTKEFKALMGNLKRGYRG